VQYAGATFKARLGYSGRVSTTPPSRPTDVIRADGAALVVSRTAIDRVGLLDESLFAYVEDVDWSFRIRDAGFGVIVVPDARVRHKGSASTGGGASTASLYYSARNTIVVGERWRQVPLGLRTARRIIVLGSHLARAALQPNRLGACAAVLAGFRDARRGRLGPR